MRHLLSLSSLLCSTLLSFLLAVAPTAAEAQVASTVPPRRFEADLFQPAIGPRNFLILDAPEVPGHLQFSVGAFFDYQRNAYDVYAVDANSQLRQTAHVVGEQYKTEIQAAFGLIDRLQIGVALPITFLPFGSGLKGDDVDSQTGLATGKYAVNGIGDLRFEAKGILTTAGSDDQFVLAALLGGTAPTGKANSYLRNNGATGRAKVLASLQVGRVRLGAQVGMLARQSTTTLGATIGNQLLYGGGGSIQILKRFEALAEVTGRSGIVDFSRRWWDENPVEADVAIRAYPVGMVGVTAGLGTGLGKGIGAPRGRLFLGAVFTPDFRDADNDGVYDSEDRCPDQPEDRDGFKDRDGCPEPDNDYDGIPDTTDRCPNDAEDLDQFEDTDGCPELDNDKDGIPDLNDACPNASEDGRGKRPKDGCPSTAEDADGDGINDTIDKCPDEPEDRDTFQDDDGCPEPDNDGDGIPDGFDNCPNEAEDADGFEDEDGCPELDNDKDGYPDAADKCPDKPETLNLVDDDDGCPDAGAEIVKLSEDAIELSERLHFAGKGSRAEMKDSAVKMVGLVALVLKGHPEIKKLRIEVRADNASKDETQRRAEAIRAVLVSRGVDSARLIPVGAGGGSTRVSFIILEKQVAKPPTSSPAPGSSSGSKPAAGTPEGGGTSF